jgi:serine/threonine protein phosphatase PrpC
MEFYSSEKTHIYTGTNFENIVYQSESYDFGIFFSTYPGRSSDDCLFVSENEGYLLVGIADGAGGHQRAADASSAIGNCLVELFQENPDFEILKAVDLANQSVIDLKCGARSTLNFFKLKDEEYKSVNIGDSELIHWNTKQRVIYQSTPQTVPGLLYKAEELSGEENLEHPLRSQVYHLLGDQNLTCETAAIKDFKVGHSILVGCDGLFDNYTHEELIEAFSGPDFKEQFFNFSIGLDNRLQTQSLRSLDDTSFALIRKK